MQRPQQLRGPSHGAADVWAVDVWEVGSFCAPAASLHGHALCVHTGQVPVHAPHPSRCLPFSLPGAPASQHSFPLCCTSEPPKAELPTLPKPASLSPHLDPGRQAHLPMPKTLPLARQHSMQAPTAHTLALRLFVVALASFIVPPATVNAPKLDSPGHPHTHTFTPIPTSPRGLHLSPPRFFHSPTRSPHAPSHPTP
eukprot:195529-Chlamydomonas_euryale.AAC.10